MVDLIGWCASALFVASFLLPPKHLRPLQIAGAVLWGTYGLIIQSTPLVVSNVLFVGAAAYSAWRDSRPFRRGAHPV